MRRPKRLKQGDRVGVVAPAGPVDPKILKKGLRALERMGFYPVLGKHVLARDRYPVSYTHLTLPTILVV